MFLSAGGAPATPRFAPTRVLPATLAAAVAALALAVFSASPIAAQEAGNLPETAAPAPLRKVNPHKRINTSQLVAAPSQAQPAPAGAQPDPATPPVPEAPHWPVNDQPEEPTVTWDSHGLSIEARNSSLEQILKDISTATGSTVEGISGDERVFGVYGPGQPRDVLSELLLGAGYNVIMIGDQGGGAPRQILLAARHSTEDQATPNRNAAASNSDDDSSDNDVEEQPVQQPPIRPGFPGGPPRTPQQMLQERQERMQQMQQQRQNNPPPPPNPQTP